MWTRLLEFAQSTDETIMADADTGPPGGEELLVGHDLIQRLELARPTAAQSLRRGEVA
jgi:hypothetical protein